MQFCDRFLGGRRAVGGIAIGVALLFNFGCRTANVQFESESRVVLAANPRVPATSPLAKARPLPVALKKEELPEQPLRFESPGRTPQIWIFLESAPDNLTYKVDLAQPKALDDVNAQPTAVIAPAKQAPVPPQVDVRMLAIRNATHRLVLRSFHALLSDNPDEALALADNLIKISPHIASAHVLRGLALIAKSRPQEARAELLQAKGLDPDDGRVAQLLDRL